MTSFLAFKSQIDAKLDDPADAKTWAKDWFHAREMTSSTDDIDWPGVNGV